MRGRMKRNTSAFQTALKVSAAKGGGELGVFWPAAVDSGMRGSQEVRGKKGLGEQWNTPKCTRQKRSCKWNDIFASVLLVVHIQLLLKLRFHFTSELHSSSVEFELNLSCDCYCNSVWAQHGHCLPSLLSYFVLKPPFLYIYIFLPSFRREMGSASDWTVKRRDVASYLHSGFFPPSFSPPIRRIRREMNRCHVSQALSQHAQTDRLVDSDMHSASHRMCCSLRLPDCRIPKETQFQWVALRLDALQDKLQLGRIIVTRRQKEFYLHARFSCSRHWKSRINRLKSGSALAIKAQRLRLRCAAFTFMNSSCRGELGSCWNVIWIVGELLISCLVLPDPTRGRQAPVLSAITSEHIPPPYVRNSIVSSAWHLALMRDYTPSHGGSHVT